MFTVTGPRVGRDIGCARLSDGGNPAVSDSGSFTVLGVRGGTAPKSPRLLSTEFSLFGGGAR